MPAASRVIAQCAGCGRKNRIPAGSAVRCGHCKRPFTALELQRAALGDRADVPKPPLPADSLEDEEDEDLEEDWDEEQDREED